MTEQQTSIQDQESRALVRVAIVGRPNVGKSALFNRMVRRRIAIVHDKPGITRDRIAAKIEEGGRLYEFLDTGGIGIPEEGAAAAIPESVRLQAEAGMESADLILFVVDAQEGIMPLDREIARELRRFKKPVWLVVNKVDHDKHDPLEAGFAELGFEPRFAVSAAHGRGIDGLWSALEGVEGRAAAGEMDTRGATRLAVVGRPNVGKSTLINRLLGAERVIVSEAPGTTRDSIDIPMRVEGKPYVLIDTAGMRHARRLDSSVEVFSKMRAEKSIRRSDISVIVIDASAGITRQDKVIAGYVQEEKKPCLIVVNKWDLNEQKVDGRTRRLTSRSEYEKDMRGGVPFLDHAPLLFTSGLEGYRAENLWRLIEKIDKSRKRQLGTGPLNRIFKQAQNRMPAPMRQGRRLKIFYAVQKPEEPVPTFVLFVNQARLMDEGYGRYLQHCLRAVEPFTGCPIVFQLRERERQKPRERHEKVERKRQPGSDYF